MKNAAFFVVHWDGKILQDLTGKAKHDRLPVIVTSGDIEQILGVPQLESGTGRNICDAVYQLLNDWNIASRIQAMSFDTTASNTGPIKGAAVLLELLMERDIMYLPCRHHIYELVMKEVFRTKMGETTGPEVPIFKRFQDKWKSIDQQDFIAGVKDEIVAAKLITAAPDEILNFCYAQLGKQHRRDDYRELLEMTVLFLGGDLGEYRFRPLGPIHHARFMAKTIYSLKMFMFRCQFRSTPRQLNGLRDVCVFVVRVYVKAWFECTEAIKAPNQDLNFLKALSSYTDVDVAISKATVIKFKRHLWYLAEEGVALAFFDSDVSHETKTKMLVKLNEEDEEEYEDEQGEANEEEIESEEEEASDESEQDDDDDGESIRTVRHIKKIEFTFKNIKEQIASKDLSDFVTSKTKFFFQRFKLPQDFLKHLPHTWSDRDDYQQALITVQKLNVVNDTAERGVKMVQEYNRTLCRNDEELQYLIQVVSDYKKKYPSHAKSMLQ